MARHGRDVNDRALSNVLRQRLHDRVGGFFHNARHEPGVTCTVCTGPADGARCWRCARDLAEFGTRLADRVLILAYARGKAPSRHQSEHTLYAYKALPPSPKSVDDLKLMIMTATELHGSCVTRVDRR